jgi:hypothetical protein
MELIKKEDVLEAYKKTGITAVEKNFIDRFPKKKGSGFINCGCALTALYLYQTGETFDDFFESKYKISQIFEHHEAKDYEAACFYRGFDGTGIGNKANNPTLMKFYENGQEVRKYLEENGIIVKDTVDIMKEEGIRW